MSNPEVLAKAEHTPHKVIAITHGTSALGKALCEVFASAGATVYALDTDATALAHMSISFRQNKLRLRGVPCDLESEASITEAIQEITSHAPPVDLWIHACALTTEAVDSLKLAFTAFGRHFDMRGKGHISLLIPPTLKAEERTIIQEILSESELTKITAINLVNTKETTPSKIAIQVFNISTNTPGIHLHSIDS
ncbi:MAG: SDR family NAD(P)-dependent oxidoreductase [Saprospiraceae bacterium]